MRKSAKNLIIDARMYNHSGIGVYLQNLLPRIISHAKSDSVVVKLIGKSIALSHLGVEILECDAGIYGVNEQIEVAKLARGADVLWIPHYNIPILHRGKMIVTVHDVAHLALPEYRQSLPKTLYARLLFKAINFKAARIITVSEFTKNEAERLAGLNRNKMQVIYNGVDEDWYQQRKQPHENPYFIYVGNVKPHKNLLNLIKAFELCLNDIPHKLVIVGKKDGFITGDTKVAEYAERLGDKLEFTGFVDDISLKSLVANADFLAMPSLYEGFGLPPLEAMACGTPVISSNAASLPEVCGYNALYFNPHDIQEIAARITEIACNHELRASLSEASPTQARKFNWDESAHQHYELMRGIYSA